MRLVGWNSMETLFSVSGKRPRIATTTSLSGASPPAVMSDERHGEENDSSKANILNETTSSCKHGTLVLTSGNVETLSCDTAQQQGEQSKVCQAEGCTSNVRVPGFCYRHAPRKLCLFPTCSNVALRHSVCVRHGARRKRCKVIGCSKGAIKGGVCCSHGAKTKCTFEGCQRHAQRQGRCIRHGAKVSKKLCSVEDCTSQAKAKGVCFRHGAEKKLCRVEGCDKGVQKYGVCVRHGAKTQCIVPNCTNNARKAGLCMNHNPETKLCTVAECKSRAINGGEHCSRHKT